MRTRFDEQLEQLNVELIKMGALCEEAIAYAIKALFDGDCEMREKAFDAYTHIDQLERDIESLCLKLLLQQQPVATDLRIISSALKMISDMERIGDQSSDIAEITEYISSEEIQNKTSIKNMAEAAIHMVTQSIDSFVKKDLKLAKHVIMSDNIVDDLFVEIKKDLIAMIAEERGRGEYYLDLLMIAKYLERIGDHAVSIAGWVVFSITGKHDIV